MIDRLFDVPEVAMSTESPLPAGGLGVARFSLTPDGDFTDWRMPAGLPPNHTAVRADQFHVWMRQGHRPFACTLNTAPEGWPRAMAAPSRCRVLFPFTWAEYQGLPESLALEQLRFSPLLPRGEREASLPVYVLVWRAGNRSPRQIEVALMLSWAGGWPGPPAHVAFDMQHDNLCITGALGDPSSQERFGIAVPDLHSEGIYLQGMEPWEPAGGASELWDDFAADGELAPTLAGNSSGAAAWVKFELDPGEVKEVPFLIVWHFPVCESGPFSGEPPRYTRYLEKVRPDNAIVWLAEEPVQTFGAETANYRYWMNEIRDWHASLLRDQSASAAGTARRINELRCLLDAETWWTVDGRFELLPGPGQTSQSLAAALARAISPASLWPELADSFDRLRPPG